MCRLVPGTTMPNLDEIRGRAKPVPLGVLGDNLAKLHRLGDRDIILYAVDFIHPYSDAPPGLLSINDDDIQRLMTVLSAVSGKKKRPRKLDLILHSPGGSPLAAEQIVNYLRAKYEHIRVIVPQNAMSAATMIACAADEVVMGHHSALGPTDPQIVFGNAQFSAQSVLNEFHQACNSEGAMFRILATKIASLPPGLIDACHNALQLSEKMVAEWLYGYMKLSKSRAEKTAKILADANNHLSHGRRFNIDKLKSWGLKVKSLESNQKLQDAVLSVFHAATVTFEMTSMPKLVCNHTGAGIVSGYRFTDPSMTEKAE